jgi:RNA polymerase sigma-70 factor (ECF subfamily)
MMQAMTQPLEMSSSAGFEAFFHEHYERLLKAVYLVTGNRGEAEDLAQEAFVKVYERWDKVAGLDNPMGYLYRAAINAHTSRLRRLAVAARKTFAPRHADPLEASDDRDQIRRALAGLSEGQREAIVLVEWLGMTDDEAGRVLGVAPVTVRVRISRARQALQGTRGDHDE